jgi:3-hydroxyacyl-CoA dehydrogenase
VNPPHLIPLVEVVPHPGTDAFIAERTMDFYRSLGKRPILVRQEAQGFVANRLQVALLNEAHALVSRGVVSAADLDAAVTTGIGMRWALMGPLMINALSGGGGMQGFRHLVEQLGPTEDEGMKGVDVCRRLKSGDSVDTMCDAVATVMRTLRDRANQLETERNEALVELLKMKQNSALIM